VGAKKFARIALLKTAKAIGLDDLFLSGHEHPAFIGGGGREAMSGVGDAYSTSWIAHSCISKQVKDIAGVQLRVVKDPEDMETTVSDSDKLARLIYNPHPGLTHNQLIQFMVTMLRLRGAFFLDFDAPGKAATRLVPWRDPLYWKPIVNDQEEIVTGWEYRKGSKHFVRLPSDVVVGRQIDPADPWGWQSPLAAAANPLKIDRDGDNLNAQTLAQGGESGPVYKVQQDLAPDKYDQIIHRLNSRQTGTGEPLRPIILTNGLELVDPKFTRQDLAILDQQERSAEKICAVYGMSPALLFRDDTPNRATFETRRRIYWTETLIPIMRNIEDALDQWTVPNFGYYCRFDLNDVPALREDLTDQVKVGKILHAMNIPIAAINERLGLGLDIDMIPGADSALVASTLVPVDAVLDADYSVPAATGPEDDKPEKTAYKTAPAPYKVTNKEIEARHKDAVAIINRGKARTAIEVRATKAYRRSMVKWRAKVARLADAAQGDVGAFRTAMYGAKQDLGKAMADAMEGPHRDAAVEGALSVLDLLSEERMYGTPNADIFRKTPELPVESVQAINARREYLENFKSGELIEDIFDTIETAVTEMDGPTAADIAEVIKEKARHRMNVEVNRAAMIGRTEVGTAFNSSRFGQMKASQIPMHKWLTAGDELVRSGEVDALFDHLICDGEVRELARTFPNGLEYPQENGGEAGNVINCRCSTIPVVEE
jgi:HK97 family phage portal protein